MQGAEEQDHGSQVGTYAVKKNVNMQQSERVV